MKKIFFVFIFIGSFLFAENFNFNPASDDISKLDNFCAKSHKSGIKLDNDLKNIQICDNQTKNALDFYVKNCNANNALYCYLASFIYENSGNQFNKSFNNKKEAEKYRNFGCEYGFPEACLVAVLEYSINGQKQLKDKYMKKYCKLTNYKSRLNCKEYK